MQQLAVGKQYMNFSWWHIVSALIQISASWTLRNMWQIYEMIHEIDMVAYHFRVEYDGQTCVWWWLVVNECVVKDGYVVEDLWWKMDVWWEIDVWFEIMRWLAAVDEVIGSGGWSVDDGWNVVWGGRWWGMKCGARWSLVYVMAKPIYPFTRLYGVI